MTPRRRDSRDPRLGPSTGLRGGTSRDPRPLASRDPRRGVLAWIYGGGGHVGPSCPIGWTESRGFVLCLAPFWSKQTERGTGAAGQQLGGKDFFFLERHP